jgi:hypothetical protein
MNFVEYITKLAPEGETALVVRQKPQLSNNGELQFHADGAIKCTWPAYLPTVKTKPDWAIYGNTGSFILDRFADGKVSASSANCEYVLVMMLDDIGTKSKEPPLEPTWIMETSEGSFQWGYAFKEQPTKGDFTAAIKAIAKAGYTDPGATNAVRNFRLPGSVNLKPGRNNFVSTLIHFKPELEYNLEDICAALDVVPDLADTATNVAIRLADTGKDSVVTWLNEQGMIMSAANGEGWMGVVCPNNAEHTDGNIEGRYKPLDRSYCCLHGHCVDFSSQMFLDWVAENGGPKVDHGLRDELLAEKMKIVAEKLTPNQHYPDEAKARTKQVELQELGRMEKAQWYERFAYLQNEDAYFDLIKRREMSRRAFTAVFRHIPCISLHGSGKIKIDPATCYDENRQAHNAKVLVGLTYAAGESTIVVKNGEMYGNRWINARPDVSAVEPGDISLWIDHCRRLVPESAELAHIWDIMAFKTQNPRVKINHAVLHAGDEGVGKDLMWRPFMWAISGDTEINRATLDGDTINSAWGYHLESEILVLNELKEPDGALRRQLANRLKPVIAAPPEYLTVTRKGLHPYDTLNRLFVLAFSNDPVPISLPTQDRRWFCVWSHCAPMIGDSGKRLKEWQDNGGNALIAKWLHARDISRFNPGVAPAMTEFKLNLIENSRSIAESVLVDLLQRRVGEFALGVLGSPLHGVCDRLGSHMPSGVKVPNAALLHAIKEAGWIDCGRLMSKDYTTKKQVYAAPDVYKAMNKSELRRAIEPEYTAPQLVRVK